MYSKKADRMKITKRQLKKIIIEAMPPAGVPDIVGAVTGVYGEEERQLLNDLGDMYSDMHKELYRRRPRIPMFKTVEEAEAAVEELWGEYAAKNRAREAREKEDLEFIELQRRMQELMPGEYDIELPMQSGMGRRLERRIRVTKQQLGRIICEAAIAPDLEARVMKEMESMGGIDEFGPLSLGEWDAQDFMTYLYEVESSLDYNDAPYEAAAAYAKVRFPEIAQEVDELFSEGGARDMSPPFEAFNDLVYNNVDIIGGSQDVLQGEEHTVKASDIKTDDGTYRWWMWGNNLDPIDIDIDAAGTDRDGKTWTAEDVFQTIRGGKPSSFRVPKARGEDLY
jgi:hypothetical protein